MPKVIGLLWVWASLILLAGPPNPQKALAGTDALIAELMKAYDVPGVAVGVWADGKVVLAKGYGVKSIRSRQPVTAGTTFAVGSLTKSFTAIAVATQVDAGKLDWDKPVRTYLPWFKMYDPIATELITPRDLLSHRSGLPRHDFIRFSTPLTRAELVRRIQYLPNNRTFRDVYQYNNLMYVTAGFLAGEMAGMTWEDLVRTRIFAPLGMTSSTVSVVDMQKGPDFALPHELMGDGSHTVVDFYDYQKFGVGPNGAVNSNVADLMKYLAFYMTPDQKLLSAEQRKQLWKPVTVYGDGAYALGWQTGWFRGHRIVEHSGSITGFSAYAALLPDHHVGIVVLTNSGSSLPTLATHGIADRMLGLEPVDRLKALRTARSNETNPKSASPGRTAPAKPAGWLDTYEGEYEHPAYGTIRVRIKGEGLEAVFPAVRVELKHSQAETFEFGWGRGQYAEFQVDSAGRPASVLLPLEPSVNPFLFTRVR